MTHFVCTDGQISHGIEPRVGSAFHFPAPAGRMAALQFPPDRQSGRNFTNNVFR